MLWNKDLTDMNRHIRCEMTYDKWVWSATGAEVVAFTITWPHMQFVIAGTVKRRAVGWPEMNSF
jgi:hypothetical protein